MTTEEKIKWLEHLLCKCPDVITPKDVETILGYEHESVHRWINRGWLKITKAHNAELVPPANSSSTSPATTPTP